jgi:hypothetical protein
VTTFSHRIARDSPLDSLEDRPVTKQVAEKLDCRWCKGDSQQLSTQEIEQRHF